MNAAPTNKHAAKALVPELVKAPPESSGALCKLCGGSGKNPNTDEQCARCRGSGYEPAR